MDGLADACGGCSNDTAKMRKKIGTKKNKREERW
jgi:hypothetical protein